MVHMLIAFMEIWKRKATILLPLILIPAAAFFLSMGRPVSYEAFTTLHLDRDNARSPLLRNITQPAHIDILERTLLSKAVLEDTLEEAGVITNESAPEAKQAALAQLQSTVKFDILSNELLRLTYKNTNQSRAARVLEILSFNFIHEILAPERFRLEQQVSALAEQIKYYGHQQKLAEGKLGLIQSSLTEVEGSDAKNEKLKEIVTMEFEVQRLEAQKELAQEEYDSALSQSKNLMSQYLSRSSGQVLWFVEPPMLEASQGEMQQHLSYILRGFSLAILLSAVFMFVMYRNKKKIIFNDVQVKEKLNLKAIGHIPNMGNVRVESGRLSVDVRTAL